MSGITLDTVRKEFGDGSDAVLAVEDIDLEIEDGEFLVLVGPSGCGKTTTLRCIAGLEDVTSGSIRFGTRDVTPLRARDRDVAMVFQNYALYPHMSVQKNIGFGLRLSTQLSSAEINQRVGDTAAMLGISDLLGDKPKELSGGQQQRVALGRAIIREPEVFLMDEPLSNLDAKLRAQMRTELQELQHELGTTTVYVTHDQTEAMAMGDRIAVMNDGVLQQVGPPEDVYLSPTNEFVAEFIGSPSINLFTADVEGTGTPSRGQAGSPTSSRRRPSSTATTASGSASGPRTSNSSRTVAPKQPSPSPNIWATRTSSTSNSTGRSSLPASTAPSGRRRARRSDSPSTRRRCTCSTPPPATR